MTNSFVHLHVHGDNSLLDGAGRLKNYAREAARLGQPALGLTDHGTLSGAYDHWRECTAVGVKPVIGCEFYVAPDSRLRKSPVKWATGSGQGGGEAGESAEVGGAGAYTHLTVLARDARGLRNLFRLQHRAYVDGFYRKPRIDLALLSEFAEGLIVLSGCAGSAISTRLRLGQLGEADSLVDFYKQTFGENFFIEIMSHGIGQWEDDLNRDLIDLARRHSVRMVATNDAHYVTAEQAPVHSALLCVQSQSTLAAPRFAFSGQGYFLRSHAEMVALGLPAESLDNTLAVAEMVERYDAVFERKLRFPRYPVPDGWEADEVLRQLATEGLMARVAADQLPLYEQPLRYELDTIITMGFPDYFLVEMDLLTAFRAEGIRVGPGRGSVGGSLVAYALGITDLDPLEHGLIFERFINPERVSLPDIDVDISERDRPRALEIIRERYGEDYVAQIGTLGTIGAKAALKDAVRVSGGTFAEGARRVEYLPPAKFGRQPTLTDYTGPRDDIYSLAVGLEGLTRSEGIHPAGVIVSPVPVAGVVPVRLPGGKGGAVTGFDGPTCEALGLVKMDFLGLRNLGIIDDALATIRERTGNTVGLPTLPAECSDRRTYELLASGETLGVFQLDSPGMRGLLRILRPTRFDDVSAVLALYRPGPMGVNAHTEYAHRKNGGAGGWKPEWAIHPDLETALRPVLEGTYGLIVFQEQVLEALKAVCGWSYGEAGLLFDAMRKKNHEKMEATRPDFYRAGEAHGFSTASLDALWATLVPFADYSFNRAHTAGYGLVAYWTAYLKANHPADYMAAVLTSVSEDKDRLPEYLAECQRMGIPILAPDINSSGLTFTPSRAGIHYGIGAIKGVGEKAFDAIQRKRPYRDLDDFFRRADAKVLNAGVLGALTQSGAMDGLANGLREELYVARDALVGRAVVYRAENRNGQVPLYRVPFGVGPAGLRSVGTRQEWERGTLSTVITRGDISLSPGRAVTESELRWLRDVVRANPGDTQLSMRFGSAIIKLPSVNWARVEPAIRSVPVFADA